MSKHAKSRALVALMTAFFAAPSSAAEELAKDLTSTIALLGLPCGRVVSAQRLGENDYLATCQNKMRYRVYLNAQGRVVAEKR